MPHLLTQHPPGLGSDEFWSIFGLAGTGPQPEPENGLNKGAVWFKISHTIALSKYFTPSFVNMLCNQDHNYVFNNSNLFSHNFFIMNFAGMLLKALQRRRMEEKNQERWDIWSIYFSHPCLSVPHMQKNSEGKREDGSTYPISQVGKTFGMYLSRLQCGETKF